MNKKLADLTTLTPQRLREATGDARLVVLFPRTTYRNAYLSRSLHEPDSGLFYYALRARDRSLRQFLLSLVEELSALRSQFGSQLRQAIVPRAKAADLAQALGQDLSTLSTEPFTLLLDQFDRLPEKDETKRFMEVLVTALPAHCQLLLNAREEAYLPWHDLVASNRASVVGAEYVPATASATSNMAPGELPLIEVFALGSGHILVNGRPILQWDGDLPWQLCFFVVDRAPVTRDAVFEAFWPTLSVKEATNVFHVTKRKVHEKLGVDLTKYETGVYNYNDAVQVRYDVADFVKAIATAREATHPKQQPLAQQAVALYRAPFLHQLEMDWAQERRKELAALYQGVLPSS